MKQSELRRGVFFEDYDDVTRFISYFYQIDLVKELNPQNALEIGTGNKTVYNYLKELGINITTCDFNKNLKPDVVSDIRDLSFNEKSFDVTYACEVLEHLPYADFKVALSELKRVSKKYVIISLPYSSAEFEVILRFPYIRYLFNKPLFSFFFRIPLFFKKHKFNGEHYWEIGKKGYSLKKIRKVLSKEFNIVKEVRPPIMSAHHFFVLKILENTNDDK